LRQFAAITRCFPPQDCSDSARGVRKGKDAVLSDPLFEVDTRRHSVVGSMAGHLSSSRVLIHLPPARPEVSGATHILGKHSQKVTTSQDMQSGTLRRTLDLVGCDSVAVHIGIEVVGIEAVAIGILRHRPGVEPVLEPVLEPVALVVQLHTAAECPVSSSDGGRRTLRLPQEQSLQHLQLCLPQ